MKQCFFTLSLLLVMVLTACSSDDNTQSNPGQDNVEETGQNTEQNPDSEQNPATDQPTETEEPTESEQNPDSEQSTQEPEQNPDTNTETSTSATWVNEFDGKMQEEMAANKIPGMAVALIQNSEIKLEKGYGFRDVANALPVDEHTLFHIASTHKSMTAMLIGVLVDNNIVDWDRPVVNYYPEFQLETSSATNSVTLTHLLSMTSGIPDTAEDDLADDATTEEVFSTAKSAELLGAASEHFSYSNLSSAIAGFIGVIASNGNDQNLVDNYSTLLKTHILDPIGMSRSTIYPSEAQQDGNLSKTYRLSDSGNPLLESSIDEDGDILAPSGSLKSSVNEMALYLSTQLNDGVAPNQTRIISAENLKITHNPILENYAMGWETESYKNISVLVHTGAYDGFASVLVMIPSYNIGLVLLANSEEAAESLTENAHQILIDVLIEHLPDN